MFGAILKATNSSFKKGMTCGRSIYVKKVMKLLAFIFEQPSYAHFLHQKYTKWSILKFKFHNSKISLAPLRQFLVVQTEILISVA